MTKTVPLGNIQGPDSQPGWASVIGIPERSKRPAGVAIGFSIQTLYLWPPRRGGVEANALLRWPRSRRSSPELGVPARTRSGSTGSLFPGSAVPRPPASRARPLRSRTRLRLSGAAPGPRLPGCFWAAGGAGVAKPAWAERAGLGLGSGGSSSSSRARRQSAASATASPWRVAARWRRCGERSGACKSRRTPQRSVRAACSANWIRSGSCGRP